MQGQEREEELLRDARQHLAEAEARLEAERASQGSARQQSSDREAVRSSADSSSCEGLMLVLAHMYRSESCAYGSLWPLRSQTYRQHVDCLAQC